MSSDDPIFPVTECKGPDAALHSFLYLSSFDVDAIPAEELEAQSNFFWYLFSSLMATVQDEPVSICPGIANAALVVRTVCQIHFALKEKCEISYMQSIQSIMDLKFNAERVEVPKKSYFTKKNAPQQFSLFIDMCASVLSLKEMTFSEVFQLLLCFSPQIAAIIPNLHCKSIPVLALDQFNLVAEPNKPRAIPRLEHPEASLLIRYISEAINQKTCSEFSTSIDIGKIISEEPKLTMAEVSTLLLYFNAEPIHHDLFPSSNEQLVCILFMARKIDFVNDSINIPLPVPLSYLISSEYYLDINKANSFSNFILERKVNSSIWLSTYIIKELYLDPVILVLVQKSKKCQKAAIELLDKPQCLPLLDPSNYNHSQIIACLSPDPQFPTEINDNSLISLFRLKEQKNNKEKVTKMLLSLVEYVQFITLEYVNNNGFASLLLYGGFPAPLIVDQDVASIPNSFSSLIGTHKPNQIVSAMIYYLSSMEIDQSIAEDIVLLCTHRFICYDSKQSLIAAFGDIIVPKIEQYQSNMLIFALAEAEQPSRITEALKNISSDLITLPLLSVILNFLKDKSILLKEFLMFSSKAQSLFPQLPNEQAQQLLELLISEDADNILMNLSYSNMNKEFVLKTAGKNAISHTASIIPIILSILDSITDIDPFLSSLPDDFGQPSDDFFKVLISLTKLCSKEKQNKAFKVQPVIKPLWGEDVEFEEKTQQLDIWHNSVPITTCNSSSLAVHSFKCFTCDEGPLLCLSCALLCHAHHDLIYIGKTDASCQCSSSCMCKCENPPQEIPPKVLSKPANRVNANPELLAKVLCRLATCNASSGSSPPIHRVRFHGKLESFELPQQNTDINYPPLIMNARQNYPNVGNGADMVNGLQNINESFMLTRRRAEVAPMRLGTLIKNGKFVLTAVGCKVRILSKQLTQEISHIKMPKVVLMAVVCPTHQSVVAISTLHNAYIIDIDDKGIVTQRDEIELSLRSQSSSLFVNNIMWVPGFDQYLCITCNTFAKIYNIETDLISPVSSYSCKGVDYITSTASFLLDQKPYGIFCLYPKKIAIQELSTPSTDGEIVFSTFSKLNLRTDQIVCSNSAEANMIFISYRNTLLVLRPEEIFKPNPKFISINTNFEGQLSFLCMYPNLPIAVFTHTSTNSLFTLEFTDNGCEFYCLHSTSIPVCTFAALENTMTLLSAFPYEDSMIAISSSLGIICDLNLNLTSDPTADSAIVGEGEDFEETDAITVSPSFWSSAMIDRKDIDVRGGLHESIKDVLNGNRYVFSASCPRKTAYITLNDTERMIVGFRVTVGSNGESHRPPWISIFGRRIMVNSQRSYMLPLKPSEVFPKKTYEIRFASRGNLDINFDRLEVYSMPRKQIEIICENDRGPEDWKDGSKLTDFIPRESKCLLETASKSIANAYSPSNLTEELFEQLVTAAYTNDNIADASRIILSSCLVDSKENKWARCAAEISSKVIQERKVEFWRDFSLFPEDKKSIVADSIWEENKDESGHSVVSAFFSTV